MSEVREREVAGPTRGSRWIAHSLFRSLCLHLYSKLPALLHLSPSHAVFLKKPSSRLHHQLLHPCTQRSSPWPRSMDPVALPSNPRFGRCPSSSARNDTDPAIHSVPLRGSHRRAHSETILRLPDDILFDSDTDFGLTDIEFPSFSDDNGSTGSGLPTAVDSRKSEPSEKGRPSGSAHIRSLSVDAAFFEGLGFQEGQGGGVVYENRGNHRHSSSMDGSTSPFEAESTAQMEFAKKAMAADKLAELSLIDPKRAKRILANRQSAARSKERKIRYTSELERKVQTLQTEATTLSAQLTLLQRDTTGLTSENKELKLRLQALEQQAQLRDALNETLREEVQRLKLATGEIPSVNGNSFSRGLHHQASFFSRSPQLHNLGGYQGQQFHASQPSSNGQPLSGHSLHDPMDFI